MATATKERRAKGEGRRAKPKRGEITMGVPIKGPAGERNKITIRVAPQGRRFRMGYDAIGADFSFGLNVADAVQQAIRGPRNAWLGRALSEATTQILAGLERARYSATTSAESKRHILDVERALRKFRALYERGTPAASTVEAYRRAAKGRKAEKANGDASTEQTPAHLCGELSGCLANAKTGDGVTAGSRGKKRDAVAAQPENAKARKHRTGAVDENTLHLLAAPRGTLPARAEDRSHKSHASHKSHPSAETALVPAPNGQPDARNLAPLCSGDRKRLAILEKIIDARKEAFRELGEALAEIRDKNLYRQSHQTFEAYCRDRHGFGKSEAYDKIAASQVAKVVLPVANRLRLPAPVEDHLKALAPVAEAEDQKAIYEAAAKRAKKEGTTITGKLLREERRKYETPPEDLQRERERRDDRRAARAEKGEGGGQKPAENAIRPTVLIFAQPPDDCGAGVYVHWTESLDAVRDLVGATCSRFIHVAWRRKLAAYLRELADGAEQQR